MRMRYGTATIAIFSVLAIGGAGCLSGCSTSPKVVASATDNNNNNAQKNTNTNAEVLSQVAATTNSTQITENDVANYIKQYRIYQGCSDDIAWATLLDESGQTAADVRKSAIEQLATDAAYLKAAEDASITVTDEEIDAAVKSARTDANLVSDDSGWIALLQTTGYDETSYRNDVKIKLVKEKVLANVLDGVSASESQINALAATSPSTYTGKRVIEVKFKFANESEAENFLQSIDGVTESDARNKAAAIVDEGSAQNVVDFGWTCLNTATSALSAAIENTRAGHAAMFADDDGTYTVAYVAEEYMEKSNARLSLTDMPQEIKAKLISDACVEARETKTSEYERQLLADYDLVINEMPSGLPYDVDMGLSTYGTSNTTEEASNQAENDAANALNELEAAGANQNVNG